jgi:hypothetical protein
MKLHNSYKLITREDPFHSHKILGGLCLLHFIYRFWLLIFIGSMELYHPNVVGFVCCHGLLSLSSLGFHISNVRNKTAPMIYPEFRFHSIIFALRSIACFALTYYKYSILYRFAVCYITMGLADVITIYYKDVGLWNC